MKNKLCKLCGIEFPTYFLRNQHVAKEHPSENGKARRQNPLAVEIFEASNENASRNITARNRAYQIIKTDTEGNPIGIMGKARRFGNSCHLMVPSSWADKKVRIIVKENV